MNGTRNGLDNLIIGSDEDNIISGGIGKDRIGGRGGDDTLIGGRDADTFIFKPNFGHDVVTDFAVTASYSAIRICILPVSSNGYLAKSSSKSIK